MEAVSKVRVRVGKDEVQSAFANGVRADDEFGVHEDVDEEQGLKVAWPSGDSSTALSIVLAVGVKIVSGVFVAPAL